MLTFSISCLFFVVILPCFYKGHVLYHWRGGKRRASVGSLSRTHLVTFMQDCYFFWSAVKHIIYTSYAWNALIMTFKGKKQSRMQQKLKQWESTAKDANAGNPGASRSIVSASRPRFCAPETVNAWTANFLKEAKKEELSFMETIM